jgi:hypothetical protein
MNPKSWALRALAAIGVGAFLSATAAGSAFASSAVPYTDPNAVGYIGLCNQAGQQITSGSLDTVPFVWRAVSSQPALAPYNNAYRTATLYAYLPQPELPAGDWSGEQLTASSRYTNPDAPMAAATGGDEPLSDMVSDYPPEIHGFLELRIYLSTADQPAYNQRYPVLNIQVTGDKWHAVGGGPVNCHSGTSESVESILLPKSDTSPSTTTAGKSSSHVASQVPTSAHGVSTSARGGSTSAGTGTTLAGGGTTSARGGSTSAADAGTSARSGPAAVASSPSRGGGSHGSTPVVLFVIAGLAVVFLASAGALLARRRHAHEHPRLDHTSDPLVKGSRT